MKQDQYLHKAEAILSDRGMYKPVEITIATLEKRVRDVLARECSAMDRKLYNSILPKDTRWPEWYGLPKDHKEAVPLRPVVSAWDSPTTAISIILERILHQLLQFLLLICRIPLKVWSASKTCVHISKHQKGPFLLRWMLSDSTLVFPLMRELK